MSQFLKIHPENPQLHLIRQAANMLMKEGVIVYPTDSAYALGCQLGNKKGIQRIRQIRQLKDQHCLTLLCRDISEMALFAQLENPIFRLIKANTPGPYTFLLPVTSHVPRYLVNAKRKTIGIRIPDNKIVHALLEMIDQPLVSTTLILPDSDLPLLEPEAICDILGKRIDLVIDGGFCGLEPTTVVDLSTNTPEIIRCGKGDVKPFQSI
ncbi:L-threonylcarbamoyladenylate synthase [Rickettsiella endosymbiont of Miltochrista miniata]|uniref:L-threonylcarbamoyladenylate synthase n=1 Tax=Rickettsiella endosymbiont of Miltochrista miniata TaxID=3066239 RepID=UPI00313AB5AB